MSRYWFGRDKTTGLRPPHTSTTLVVGLRGGGSRTRTVSEYVPTLRRPIPTRRPPTFTTHPCLSTASSRLSISKTLGDLPSPFTRPLITWAGTLAALHRAALRPRMPRSFPASPCS